MHIKHWEKYQHYQKKRAGSKLPWIKLYTNLLDDIKWNQLSGDASKVLAKCWMIASETLDGSLPPVAEMAFRFRMDEKNLKRLLSMLSEWVYQDASNLLAKNRVDVEEEEEEEEEKKSVRVKLFSKPKPDEVTAYALSIGFQLDGNKFTDHYDSNGWKVGRNPMKDWKATVRTWKQRDNGNAKGWEDELWTELKKRGWTDSEIQDQIRMKQKAMEKSRKPPQPQDKTALSTS